MNSLSIVIVNYNVRHFILQCLESIYASDLTNVDLKVIVVDNASIDGSITAIKNQFPHVDVIQNDINLGFGKANNIGIKSCHSEYCLLLNPDTIIEEQTIQKCLEIMDANPHYGALGVKMVDGTGVYLKESKRSLPSPLASFFKITRLNDLHPKSKFLNGYYTTDRTGNQNEEVEVLCGAFMFCRTSVLKSLGGFDEAFFMYGEDIDLSKRILESGHKIFYTAESKIIHFKGESSKKASVNYIKSFYSAMMIYVDKHFSSNKAWLTKLVLKIAIFLSGLLRATKEFVKAFIQPILDLALLIIGLHGIKHFWSSLYFGDSDYYDAEKFMTNSIVYAFIWVSNLWFWGWYDGRRKIKSLFYAIILGTLIILIGYALIPLEYRSSRVIILMGSLVAFILPAIVDQIRSTINMLNKQNKLTSKNVIIVGHKSSESTIIQNLKSNHPNISYKGLINPSTKEENADYLSNVNHLNKVVELYKIDEVIFSHGDMGSEAIIDLMTIAESKVIYKIAGLQNQQIIGSQSNTSQGQIIDTYSTFNLTKAVYKRLKRLLDFTMAVLFILLFPLAVLVKNYRLSILPNIPALLVGGKTLISYSKLKKADHNLPKIKPGIIELSHNILPKDYPHLVEPNINHWYAKSYTPFIDIELLKNVLL